MGRLVFCFNGSAAARLENNRELFTRAVCAYLAHRSKIFLLCAFNAPDVRLPLPAMAPKNLELPLKIRRLQGAHETGKPTNLYLPPTLKAKAVKIAEERYGWKLSMLVRRLLQKETEHKRGVVNTNFK